MTMVMMVTIIFQVFIMVLLPLIFLIFYTRRNVKATCEMLSAPASPSAYAATSLPPGAATYTPEPASGATVATSAAKGLPVPIILSIIWFSFVALSCLVTAMWLPLTALFGVKIEGLAARLVLLAFAGANAYCAWSFYKLKVAGWWAALGLFVFLLVSGIFNVIRLNPLSLAEDFYRRMGVDPQQMRIYTVDPHTMKVFSVMGLLIQVAFCALILYTKPYFQKTVPTR